MSLLSIIGERGIWVFFVYLEVRFWVGPGFTENLLKGFTLKDSFFYSGAGVKLLIRDLDFCKRWFTAFPITSGDPPLPVIDSIVGVLSLDCKFWDEEVGDCIMGLSEPLSFTVFLFLPLKFESFILTLTFSDFLWAFPSLFAEEDVAEINFGLF